MGIRISLLKVTPEHSAQAGRLALLHQDPFGRMLVAQALGEPMRLLTHNAMLASSYSDTIIVV